MSGPYSENTVLAAKFLMQQAEAAGLRLVPIGEGKFGLAVVGEDGNLLDIPPLPVASPEHAGFVIGGVQAVRAELRAHAEILLAQIRAKRTTRGPK